MKLPNVASLAIIAAVVAALEYIAANANGTSAAWWIPVLILVVGALAKAGQVYLQAVKAAEQGARAVEPDEQPGKMRSWLLD